MGGGSGLGPSLTWALDSSSLKVEIMSKEQQAGRPTCPMHEQLCRGAHWCLRAEIGYGPGSARVHMRNHPLQREASSLPSHLHRAGQS